MAAQSKYNIVADFLESSLPSFEQTTDLQNAPEKPREHKTVVWAGLNLTNVRLEMKPLSLFQSSSVLSAGPAKDLAEDHGASAQMTNFEEFRLQMRELEIADVSPFAWLEGFPMHSLTVTHPRGEGDVVLVQRSLPSKFKLSITECLFIAYRPTTCYSTPYTILPLA